MAGKRKTAILVSGGGTNLQALIDEAKASDFPAEISLVISNKADAFALKRAEKANIPTIVISNKHYASREEFDEAVHQAMVNAGIELVCLAGFMRILTPGFVSRWEGRMLNIHPSLLPLFKGLHTHEQAIASGMRFAGCTVHFVSSELDSGPIISQAVVPVLERDTPDQLAQRVLNMEHQIYPHALRMLAEGSLTLAAGKVVMKEQRVPRSALANPEPY